MRNEARVYMHSAGGVWIRAPWSLHFMNYVMSWEIFYFEENQIWLGGFARKGIIPYDKIDSFSFFRGSNCYELMAFRRKENEEWNNDIKDRHIDDLVKGGRRFSTPIITYVGIIKRCDEQKLIKEYLTKIDRPFSVYAVKPSGSDLASPPRYRPLAQMRPQSEARVFSDNKGGVYIDLLWGRRFLNSLRHREALYFDEKNICSKGFLKRKSRVALDAIEWIAFFKASNGDELMAFRVKENEHLNREIKEKYIDQLIAGKIDISTPSVRYAGIIKRPDEQKLIKDYLTKIGLPYEVYVAPSKAVTTS